MIYKSPHAETIVGVNKHRLDKEEPVEVLSIDNSKVISVQVSMGREGEEREWRGEGEG